MRLVDGKIGRVQSLAVQSDPATVARRTPISFASNDAPSGSSEFSRPQSGRAGREGNRRGHPIYDDSRDCSEPQQTRSLADYIKIPSASKLASTAQGSSQGNTNQLQLEKEFPMLDAALIAAIIADHDDAQSARSVLSSLS